MLALMTLYVVSALFAPIVMRRGRLGFLILAAVPAVSFAYVASCYDDVVRGAFPTSSLAWAPQLGFTLNFRLDHLSYVLALIVTGIGALVLVYSSRYFSQSAQGLGRFAAVFIGFTGAMLGLVTTNNTLSLYMFWELTTVLSFLLIGHSYSRSFSRRAAMQALIVTVTGGLSMLTGLIILGTIPGGSFDIAELVDHAQAGMIGVSHGNHAGTSAALITTAIVLILIGAFTKSAIVPFHFWLPAAMAAPTPVSAYLHSAAMVKAGIYLIARFAPGLASSDVWRIAILFAGTITLILGGYRALKQTDLKLLLAFGTVSQLGLLSMFVGYGTASMMLAGLTMLVAHALFKSALFLCVGVVDWATGTRDLRELNGLWRKMPILSAMAAIATASMIGLPPFLGFVAKEAALHSLLVENNAVAYVLLLAVTVGSLFTVAYGLRFWWGAFADKSAGANEPTGSNEPAYANKPAGSSKPAVANQQLTANNSSAASLEPHKNSLLMLTPIAVLVGGGIACGFSYAGFDRMFSPYVEQLSGSPGELVLWGGVNTALAITVSILVLGLVIFAVNLRWFETLQNIEFPLRAERAFHIGIETLEAFSRLITSLVQRGSLPVYLSTIFFFMLVTGGFAYLFAGGNSDISLRAYDAPTQLVVAIIAALAALLGARARHRMKAVLLIGVSGYAVALIYQLHGAPDLALTQTLAETMTLVVFILVLRCLPAYFSTRPIRWNRWVRIALASGVGAGAAVLAWFAANARMAASMTQTFHDEAQHYGYGKNIVNVTLVDVRAWDTFGEISVVIAAAVGISSLLFIRDRSGRIDRFRNLPQVDRAGMNAHTSYFMQSKNYIQCEHAAAISEDEAQIRSRTSEKKRVWLAGSSTLPEVRRSEIFEVGTRIIFHTMVIVSLFLLFSGHNHPGGGFAAGIMAGVALVLRYVAGGRYELGAALPLHPGHVMGSGLLLAAIYALFPLLFGGTIMQTVKLEAVLPAFGPIKLATALFFDVGVYLIVTGLVLEILRSLGAEIDRHGDLDAHAHHDTAQITPALDRRREERDAWEAAHQHDDDPGRRYHDANGASLRSLGGH
ncbi:multicomponent Na+:H+ antiporter subunit A [Arcanobacterium pluranimalium]|uniref:Na+/H+ antiporter subunit A n=1 Tax=Arcanobacterium pluranimalium TaxID=108028 RepID=UPI00195D7F2B|nr:Na+/H+ antiporter subunit A [Arcanobacterium pluranimalium]MBM7824293.1 multicomponent Na+:H+ antiporter subunit A [Arcanobacterium pluranimalium]